MKNYFIALLVGLVAFKGMAQDDIENFNPITTGVPFLLIAADPRAGALGDIGVTTSTDAFSQHWNPAKYAFAKSKQGVGVSYTPYLSKLVNDIFLADLVYYNRLSERSAIGASLRYFKLGDIEARQTAEEIPLILSPNEFTLDLSYSLRLSDQFSMAVAGRYLRSDLKLQTSDDDASAASSFAVDVAGYYQSEEIPYNEFDGRWRMGFNISNIGPKIKYDNSDNSESFLPTNLALGGGFDFILDEYNTLGVSVQLNKLLVPTPQNPDLDGDGTITPEERAQNNRDYRDIGFVSGMFKSFGDAPGGFSEELKEFTWAIGAEYWYQESFAFRAGYFNESDMKGGRKYASIGAGFKYTSINIDISYLFGTGKVVTPLDGTLRFGLTFNFGDEYTEY